MNEVWITTVEIRGDGGGATIVGVFSDYEKADLAAIHDYTETNYEDAISKPLQKHKMTNTIIYESPYLEEFSGYFKYVIKKYEIK